jgi:cyclopropane-fatty-acyl-phospholipid synthase
MSSSTFNPSHNSSTAPLAARTVIRLLQNLQHGVLSLHLPDGRTLTFGRAGVDHNAAGISGCFGNIELRGVMHVRNWGVFAAVLKTGDIGLAESFIAGDWSTPHLTVLLQLFIANRSAFEAVIYGSWWGSIWYRAKHWLNRNSRRGSQKNIHAHYDLGNEFYRLWLDPSMNYSSAWFEGNLSGDLLTAQHAKMRRALAECNVQAGQHVLEIGCGWGAVAELAEAELGAKLVGVTLSREQLVWGQKRLADAGLSSELRLQDYRDIHDGPFDAVVSIEMFEAVGREYWPSYFNTIKAQLKTGGKACIQSITIRDDLFEKYIKSTDFIQQYIFPGGLLPSPSAFRAAVAQAGLKVINELDFGFDYAETLKRWRQRFLSADGSVRQLGFDTRFVRIWEFYLGYCEAAFSTRNTSVMQFTLQHA